MRLDQSWHFCCRCGWHAYGRATTGRWQPYYLLMRREWENEHQGPGHGPCSKQQNYRIRRRIAREEQHGNI